MVELYADAYHRLTRDGDLVRIDRLATPFPSLEAMTASHRGMAAAAQGVSARRLLVDLRQGPPGRNDAEFEEAGGRWRASLFVGPARVAVLVRTAVGRLHVQRLARTEGWSAPVFHDEAEALAWLRAPSSAE